MGILGVVKDFVEDFKVEFVWVIFVGMGGKVGGRGGGVGIC